MEADVCTLGIANNRDRTGETCGNHNTYDICYVIYVSSPAYERHVRIERTRITTRIARIIHYGLIASIVDDVTGSCNWHPN